jgi:trans-aconitate 2-methyltransferase
MSVESEWHGLEYDEVSSLQKWLADRSLAQLTLRGDERVLDVGCGDGKITAEIADRLPTGSILGIDRSHDMIDYARKHNPRANLDFAVCGACEMAFPAEFDLAVSFNTLHWVHEQEAALRALHDSLKAGGAAFLQMVGHGTRKSLEHVISEICDAARWAEYFVGFQQPYVHFTPQRYTEMATACGFTVQSVPLVVCKWDFKTRDAFVKWAEGTFSDWTSQLPEALRDAFSADVLDAYGKLGSDSSDPPNLFVFYQMMASLRRSA